MLERDDEAVEGAEALAVIGVGVVEAAREVRADAAVERRVERRDAAAVGEADGPREERRPRELLRLGEGARLAGLGVAIGLAGAFLLTRLMGSLLFGVGPRDPLTFLLVPGVLAAVALAATDLPARRASRVDPSRALRGE